MLNRARKTIRACLMGACVWALALIPSFAVAAHCELPYEDALQIVKKYDSSANDLDRPGRKITGMFYPDGVPRARIDGGNGRQRERYVDRMMKVLAGKQVWVIDAPLALGPGVKGWDLQFFVDACKREVIDVLSE